MTFHFGEDKQGKAAPARIHIDGAAAPVLAPRG